MRGRNGRSGRRRRRRRSRRRRRKRRKRRRKKKRADDIIRATRGGGLGNPANVQLTEQGEPIRKEKEKN